MRAETREALTRLAELTRYQTTPIIPRERPSTAKERNEIAREVAKWLVKNAGRIIEGMGWLEESETSIKAYLDQPKSFEELRDAASTPKPGYDIHHIVEQTSAENDKFPRSMINARENLVRIPRYKHWEINAWYGRPSKEFGGMSPREYLRGKSWEERLRIGLDALVQHKVMKP